jgi:deoxyribodipyrimidine photo-lyase
VTGLAIFTRDLRVRDNPMLAAAVASPGITLCVFAIDEHMLRGMHASPNRARFLRESLTDLARNLAELGLPFTVIRGSWVEAITQFAELHNASTAHIADDVSLYAQQRYAKLTDALADTPLVHHPGVTVVPPSAVATTNGAYKVFTPYYRRWLATPWRSMVSLTTQSSPAAVNNNIEAQLGNIAVLGELSPNVDPGGETAGLERLRRWAAEHLHEYGDIHDDLARDATSRMGAYLHFGCISPLEVATRLRDRPGAEPLIRQLCWRDFYHQFLAAFPNTSKENVRARNDTWHDDPDAFEAWCAGQTGFPIVDAAMRQLRQEGFMHNRARMIVASFLTKDLYIDWRRGAAHFMTWLNDGDVANNQLNWQWTAGTGTDTNPHRILSPHRQAERFDPRGDYVRRYVPELAGVSGKFALNPDDETRRRCNYPMPIVDHNEAIAAFKATTTTTAP